METIETGQKLFLQLKKFKNTHVHALNAYMHSYSSFQNKFANKNKIIYTKNVFR